jgi:hypothetical protein
MIVTGRGFEGMVVAAEGFLFWLFDFESARHDFVTCTLTFKIANFEPRRRTGARHTKSRQAKLVRVIKAIESRDEENSSID